ncbi:MAG TPA: WG repeat-containing protein, partial [Candidatus Angelobacter sp.]
LRARERANLKLLPVRVNGKYGFIDRTGKRAVQPQFDGSKGFREGRGLICVGSCGALAGKPGEAKYGYIDESGKIVINPQYDAADPFVEGLAAVCSGDCSYSSEQKKWGFINKDGVMVIPPQFGRVVQFHGGVAAVCVGKCTGYGSDFVGKWGLITREGKFVVNPQFDEMGFFAVGGIMEVTVGKGDDAKKGYIDDKGNFIWQPSR